ncbi:MAG: hypothetical protein AAF647_13355 [Pseudomonadota bacterium]
MQNIALPFAFALALGAGLAGSALAAPEPIEAIESTARATISQARLAPAPALPFAAPGEAMACALAVDPLPDMLVLHLPADADAERRLAFCFSQ